MFTAQGNTLATLRHVQSFLNEHAAQLPSVNGSSARRKLDEAVSALTGHVTQQSGQTIAVRGALKKKQELRVALLKEHMAPIALVARADLPHNAELRALRMPKGQPSVDRLAAAARGMAAEAAKHADVFTSVGLPADCLVQIESAAQAMLDVHKEAALSRSRVKGATASLQSLLASARRVVPVLDVLVRRDAAGDTDLLASWKQVKRVPKTPGRVAGAVASGSAPAPAPAPAPVVVSSAEADVKASAAA